MNKPSLQLRQSQSLVMTEQLKQSIQLLQYSAVELQEFVAQELEKNPLLTMDDGSSDVASLAEERDVRERSGSSGDEDGGLYTQQLDVQAGDGSGSGLALDASNEDIWGGDVEGGASLERGGFSGDYYGGGVLNSAIEAIENSYSEAIGLKDHVLEQVMVELDDPEARMIAVYMTDLLDEAGYLREPLEGVAEALGIEVVQVEAVLAQLQRLDPPGIFARDLQECLRIQLQEKGFLDRSMGVLLEHLDMLAAADIKKLAKICGEEEEILREMIADIKALDPRPGSHFGVEQVQTLVPDVLVKRQAEGWRVELNHEVLPRVLVNREYYTDLSGKSREKEDKKFLSEHLANANWLVKALDQRAQSLLKVASELVTQQEMFFEHGIRHLRPMTLRQIAEQIDLHESTVSRVVQGKFLTSSRGVYPMKFFFSSALSDAGDGEGTSSRTVMHMIREIIDGESPDKILSDEVIASMLRDRGIDVARRTVVKYRQSMGIGSSSDRRKEKRRV